MYGAGGNPRIEALRWGGLRWKGLGKELSLRGLYFIHCQENLFDHKLEKEATGGKLEYKTTNLGIGRDMENIHGWNQRWGEFQRLRSVRKEELKEQWRKKKEKERRVREEKDPRLTAIREKKEQEKRKQEERRKQKKIEKQEKKSNADQDYREIKAFHVAVEAVFNVVMLETGYQCRPLKIGEKRRLQGIEKNWRILEDYLKKKIKKPVKAEPFAEILAELLGVSSVLGKRLLERLRSEEGSSFSEEWLEKKEWKGEEASAFRELLAERVSLLGLFVGRKRVKRFGGSEMLLLSRVALGRLENNPSILTALRAGFDLENLEALRTQRVARLKADNYFRDGAWI